ncbi:1-hydroxycarotenoid 3,4-desaturase CrtD [uncultured Mucilaginibacter sp.]|uniref:1-hydroxycarotenoid 3,4-desaturase CrtD n=1 Tax=uncultured Mucilaginibacter sp. TaxID=797541 RepID=UPI0026183E7D|nr:1-hydroxycarotenoid 3,4-desaturase CrtD [uncultured Mucilaginibacter sp.]
MSKKAIIIGAGIAGIATSIRLAVQGFSVEVFEANSYPGGKLAEITLDGFRFDAGPSLFTMPQYVDELFELAGEKPDASFTYQKLALVCRYFYPDGTSLDASNNEAVFAEEISRKTKDQPETIKSYLKNSSRIYQITNHVFLEKSLHRLSTYLNFKTLRSVLQLPQIDAFRSMHQANHAFFTDEKMVQYADRFATYNGSNPFKAPATLNVIPHLEQHFGAYFPDGGMYQITLSLVALAERLGVKFHYNSPVEKIVIERNEVKGVKSEERGFVPADVVISNADVYFTYKKLLADHPKLLPKRILKQERSSSALIFYWGINKAFPQLDLHNIFFSSDYRQEFEHIWKQKNISPDPTIYLNISSKYEAKDAPQGCENWFTMINVPSNQGQDWDKLITEARENIIQKLSKALGEDIDKLIVCENILDPRSIENKTSSYQGSLYGTSSNSQFAAFLRHANKSSKIKNLFFCGGSVHPGGGIPLALLSAKIVGDWIKN